MLAENPDQPANEEDTLLLQAILDQEVGTIANIIQAAWEMADQGSLYDRLSEGYYELTNRDPGTETDDIRLK